MLRYNKKMENSLKCFETSHDFLDKIIMIWPEFVEMEGFVLLKKDKDTEELNVEKILSLYRNRTGFEASYNEFRIEDYFDWCIGKPLEGLEMAVKLSEIWECKLKRDFPYYKFHIIISYDENFTTIRFYKSREEECNWVAIDNLDAYKEECIAVRIVE